MTIKELAEKYNLDKDEFWLFERTSKSGHATKLWIITHNACEKIAAIEKMKLENIQIINAEKELVRYLVTMSKDNNRVITTGEAMKGNCQSNYYGCIAEKRGYDRCVLKLINAYQYNIYSEIESEEFEKQPEKKENLDDMRNYLSKQELEEFIKKINQYEKDERLRNFITDVENSKTLLKNKSIEVLKYLESNGKKITLLEENEKEEIDFDMPEQPDPLPRGVL